MVVGHIPKNKTKMISCELSCSTGDKFRFGERESSSLVLGWLAGGPDIPLNPNWHAETVFCSVIEELFLFPLAICM